MCTALCMHRLVCALPTPPPPSLCASLAPAPPPPPPVRLISAKTPLPPSIPLLKHIHAYKAIQSVQQHLRFTLLNDGGHKAMRVVMAGAT